MLGTFVIFGRRAAGMYRLDARVSCQAQPLLCACRSCNTLKMLGIRGFLQVAALTMAAAFGINGSGKRGADVGTSGRRRRYMFGT